jgi:hypothetical protein
MLFTMEFIASGHTFEGLVQRRDAKEATWDGAGKTASTEGSSRERFA